MKRSIAAFILGLALVGGFSGTASASSWSTRHPVTPQANWGCSIEVPSAPMYHPCGGAVAK